MVVGHSFGGLIAQELLAGGQAAAAVAIDPAPIKGVKSLPLAQLRSAFPVLSNPANRSSHGLVERQAVPLRVRQHAVRGGLQRPARQMDHPRPRASSVRRRRCELRQALPAKVDTHLADRGPLLLASGTDDHTVPLKVTREVFGMYAKGPSDTQFHGSPVADIR